jgi:hypothetical protein
VIRVMAVTFRTVPVACDFCGADTTIETATEGDHRIVEWTCACGAWSEVSVEERHHLVVPRYGYVGSYWAPAPEETERVPVAG